MHIALKSSSGRRGRRIGSGQKLAHERGRCSSRAEMDLKTKREEKKEREKERKNGTEGSFPWTTSFCLRLWQELSYTQ